MGYFTNRQINYLNVHTGLRQFSRKLIDLFGLVFFIEMGIPVHLALLAWAYTNLIRFVTRPFSLKLIEKLGLKKATIAGSLMYIGIFPLLSMIDGPNRMLLIFMTYHGITDSLYWLAHHGWYAATGDEKDRGKQVAVSRVLITLLTVMAPIIGGIFAELVGFYAAYIAGSLSMLFAVVPLLFMHDDGVGEPMTYKNAFRKLDRRSISILLGDGFYFNGHEFIWPVILISLVGNYITFGWLYALEITISLVLYVFIGSYIDKGNGVMFTRITLILGAIVVLGRSLFVDTMVEIVIFQLLMAVLLCFYLQTLEVALFNMGKRSINILWFHYFAEMGWDVGAMLIFSTGALWTFFGLELTSMLPLALFGLILSMRTANSYFRSLKAM